MQAADVREQLDRLGGRLCEIRARVEDQLLGIYAGGERLLDALAQKGVNLAEDIAVQIGVLQPLLGAARVCIKTSAAPLAPSSPATCPISGTTRSISCSTLTTGRPVVAESPPMSRMSAPSSSS